MGKDERYTIVKYLLESGKIKKFSDIFKSIPKTVVAEDMKMHNYQITMMITHPEKFSINQFCELCEKIGVHPKHVLYMVVDKFLADNYSEQE